MVRLSVYLIPLLGLISSIGIAQASPLSPLWTKWEHEARDCVTDWTGSVIDGLHASEQLEYNGGVGLLEWNGLPFNLIDDWGDITRSYKFRDYRTGCPGSEAEEWRGWYYLTYGERAWWGGWNSNWPLEWMRDYEGWRRLDYPDQYIGSLYIPAGFWISNFNDPIERREYMFYVSNTPDGSAKVVVQIEPDLAWWNSYNPSSGDYKLNEVVAKEGTRLRFELDDMGMGEIHAKLDWTPSAERFATEEITWGGGTWRWRSEYTYKNLFYHGAYLVNRVANIHSSKIPIYPSLAALGEEDSKTELLYPEIWIRPDNVDVEIMDALTWGHIRWLRGVDPYKIEWDGKDDNGDIVPKGLYSIRVILPPDSTHEYYDSVDGGISRPIGSSNSFRIDGGVSEVQADRIVFEYKGTSTDILNQPKDCWVYMNLYDDEFRLIKRLLEGKESVPMEEARNNSWDYRPYSPGTYYLTVWGKDSLENQAHVRAGTFTVPEHTIQGIREPYPEDVPGWAEEGPIVRVRQPALVAVRTDKNGRPEWAHTQMAEAVTRNLKDMKYKLVGDTFHFVDGGYDPWVHIGLEASNIFYFAGHGNPSLIAARDDASTWHLYNTDIVYEKRFHEPPLGTAWTILMPWGYHFVEIDGCSTGADYSQLPSKFRPDSFLGWGKPIHFPWTIVDDFFWSLHGRNAKNWTKRLWDALGEGKSVNDAVIEADNHWSTRNVQSEFDLRIYGDNELHPK